MRLPAGVSPPCNADVPRWVSRQSALAFPPKPSILLWGIYPLLGISGGWFEGSLRGDRWNRTSVITGDGPSRSGWRRNARLARPPAPGTPSSPPTTPSAPARAPPARRKPPSPGKPPGRIEFLAAPRVAGRRTRSRKRKRRNNGHPRERGDPSERNLPNMKAARRGTFTSPSRNLEGIRFPHRFSLRTGPATSYRRLGLGIRYHFGSP